MDDDERKHAEHVPKNLSNEVQIGEAWLAIEIIRFGSQGRWSLEITTGEMKTITWPVPFETPDLALQIAMQTLDQIGDSNIVAFARPEITQEY